MMHMSMYFSSLAQTAAFSQITAIVDGLIQTRDNALIARKECPMPLLAFGFGTNMLRCQFQPASLRKYGYPEIRPIMNATPGAGAGLGYMDLSEIPMQLEPGEELPAYATQGYAGSQNEYCGLLWADKKPEPVKGKCLTVRATGTQTLTANTWTSCVLTFDTTLPATRFDVVGFRVESAGALAARFIIEEGWNRPGGLAHQNATSLNLPFQRHGHMGRIFSFDYQNPPALEMFSTSADTSEVVYLDIIPQS